MTKEQEEAIEIISKYLNFNEICGTRNFKEAIETVLSMLKEKDKEIEKLEKENDLAKEQLKKQCEIDNERNNLLVKVNRLESQIDEMAIFMANMNIDEEICKHQVATFCDDKPEGVTLDICAKCIKQYFERKCEE